MPTEPIFGVRKNIFTLHYQREALQSRRECGKLYPILTLGGSKPVLKNRHFLKLDDHTQEEIGYLLDLAAELSILGSKVSRSSLFLRRTRRAPATPSRSPPPIKARM